jgi:hypothetical protein
MGPEGLRLTVVHDQGAPVQLAGDAELENAITGRSLPDDRGVAQRAVRHHDWLTSDLVVHDLVSRHDLDGVGSRLPADLEGDHRFPPRQPRRLLGRDEARLIDRRDPASGEHIDDVPGARLD